MHCYNEFCLNEQSSDSAFCSKECKDEYWKGKTAKKTSHQESIERMKRVAEEARVRLEMKKMNYENTCEE